MNGRAVLASAPATGVANARVEFEGNGFDTTLTDASGNYSVVLSPDTYRIRVTPPPSAVLNRSDVNVGVGATSPQTAPTVPLAGGVRIYGTVRRQTDSTPLPGIRLSAWPSNGGGGSQSSETASNGDGSYALVVPPGGTYSVSSSIEADAPYVPVQVNNVAIAAADVAQNLSLLDAAFIRGRVTDVDSSSPIGNLGVRAYALPWTGSNSVSDTQTCADGTYSLHVPPAAGGYVVTGEDYQNASYVTAAYKAGAGTTFFSCEGTAVPAASVGSSVSGIDLALHSGGGSLEGYLRTQSSGCTSAYGQNVQVIVDDGTQHACGLGMNDWNVPSGTYRMFGIPSVALLPVLRACVFPPNTGAGLCYNAGTFPSFTSVPVPAAGSQTGVNFCIGDVVQPTVAVGTVTEGKSAGQFTLGWGATGDPATVGYRVRGATTGRPGTAQGSFPNDPPFTEVWSGPGTSASLPITSPYGYFLVTSVGSTGLEGPAKHYPIVP